MNLRHAACAVAMVRKILQHNQSTAKGSEWQHETRRTVNTSVPTREGDAHFNPLWNPCVNKMMMFSGLRSQVFVHHFSQRLSRSPNTVCRVTKATIRLELRESAADN